MYHLNVVFFFHKHVIFLLVLNSYLLYTILYTMTYVSGKKKKENKKKENRYRQMEGKTNTEN